jgi:hypothetical protein
MTKKRIGTKRRRVKKQMRRKSRKARKSMRGGNLTPAQFVEKISHCIPNDATRFPDMPFSPSGYINNDDNWTKLAQNISEKGHIEFNCDGETALIGGINLDINFENGTKNGELYGKIGESRPILLWRNGIQQTYEPPPGFTRITSQNHAPSTPPRTTTLQNSPPPLNRIVDSRNQYRSPPGSPSVGSSQVVGSLFNEEDNPDDDGRNYYPGQ